MCGHICQAWENVAKLARFGITCLQNLFKWITILLLVHINLQPVALIIGRENHSRDRSSKTCLPQKRIALKMLWHSPELLNTTVLFHLNYIRCPTSHHLVDCQNKEISNVTLLGLLMTGNHTGFFFPVRWRAEPLLWSSILIVHLHFWWFFNINSHAICCINRLQFLECSSSRGIWKAFCQYRREVLVQGEEQCLWMQDTINIEKLKKKKNKGNYFTTTKNL